MINNKLLKTILNELFFSTLLDKDRLCIHRIRATRNKFDGLVFKVGNSIELKFKKSSNPKYQFFGKSCASARKNFWGNKIDTESLLTC